MMGLSYAQLDVSTEEMENVDLYLQSLGVPARRNVNDPHGVNGYSTLPDHNTPERHEYFADGSGRFNRV